MSSLPTNLLNKLPVHDGRVKRPSPFVMVTSSLEQPPDAHGGLTHHALNTCTPSNGCPVAPSTTRPFTARLVPRAIKAAVNTRAHTKLAPRPLHVVDSPDAIAVLNE